MAHAGHLPALQEALEGTVASIAVAMEFAQNTTESSTRKDFKPLHEALNNIIAGLSAVEAESEELDLEVPMDLITTLDSKPDEDVAALVQGFHDRHRTAQQAVEAELSAFKASLGAVFASDASSSDGEEDVTLELPPERPPCEQGSG